MGYPKTLLGRRGHRHSSQPWSFRVQTKSSRGTSTGVWNNSKDGGQSDAVGGLVDGDHLVFGTIAKKVDGGHGDAVGGLVVVREGRRRGRVSSHPMGHHYSCHTSLFKFRP